MAGGPRGASFQARHLPGHPEARAKDLARESSGALGVSLQNATFAYAPDQAPVLTNLSLEIPAGAFVAITGAVGSGKSALAKALLGLYPLTSGRVLIDGATAIMEGAPTGRPGEIGYLSQEPFLILRHGARQRLLRRASLPSASATHCRAGSAHRRPGDAAARA